MSSKEREIQIPDTIIYVCNGPKCKKKGGKELRKFFKSQIKGSGLNVRVIKTGCTDNCVNAPIVCCQPENKWYAKTDLITAQGILEKITGKKVEDSIDSESE